MSLTSVRKSESETSLEALTYGRFVLNGRAGYRPLELIPRSLFFDNLEHFSKYFRTALLGNAVVISSALAAGAGCLAYKFSDRVSEDVDPTKSAIVASISTLALSALVAGPLVKRLTSGFDSFCQAYMAEQREDSSTRLFHTRIDFPMPPNIEQISAKELGRITRDFPVKYSLYGGTKLRISINANEIEPDQLIKIIYNLSIAYPQTSRIAIKNSTLDGSEIISAISRFKNLRSLIFSHCDNLLERNVFQILEKASRIYSLGFPNCDMITREFCARLAQNHLVTNNEGSSNKDIFLEAFSKDLFEIRNHELEILVDRRIEALREDVVQGRNADEASSVLGDLTRLKALLDSLDKTGGSFKGKKAQINELIQDLKEHLNPQEKTEEEKKVTRASLSGFLAEFTEKPYYAVFENPFVLKFPDFFIGDDATVTLLRAMRTAKASLTELVMDGTPTTGVWLRSCYGLPIEKLSIRDLKHAHEPNFAFLSRLSGYLKELDISQNPLGMSAFLGGIRKLNKLKSLKMDRCTEIDFYGAESVKTSFEQALIAINGNLDFLSAEEIKFPKGFRNKLLINIGQARLFPLVMTSTHLKPGDRPGEHVGYRRLDISQCPHITPYTEDIFEKYVRDEKKPPVAYLRFTQGSKLSPIDLIGGELLTRERVKGLLSYEDIFQIQYLNLKHTTILDDAAKHLSLWPLKELSLDGVKILIDDITLTRGSASKANKLRIVVGEKLTSSVVDFVKSFARINSIDINFDKRVITEDEIPLLGAMQREGMPITINIHSLTREIDRAAIEITNIVEKKDEKPKADTLVIKVTDKLTPGVVDFVNSFSRLNCIEVQFSDRDIKEEERPLFEAMQADRAAETKKEIVAITS
jgi:hypothetical protein